MRITVKFDIYGQLWQVITPGVTIKGRTRFPKKSDALDLAVQTRHQLSGIFNEDIVVEDRRFAGHPNVLGMFITEDGARPFYKMYLEDLLRNNNPDTPLLFEQWVEQALPPVPDDWA